MFAPRASIFGVIVRRKSISLVCWFAGRLFFDFVDFSGGSDPRSARAGAVETPFSMSEAASANSRFLKNFGGMSGINVFQNL